MTQDKLSPGSRAESTCGWAVCLLVLLATSIYGCCSSANRSENYRLGGSRVFHTPDGVVFAIGSRSVFENDDFIIAEMQGEPLPRWMEFLRLGKWEFRYPNGRKRAVISFEIDWYTECCTAGYCEQPYEVRSGFFEAWWPSGSPLARGTFEHELESIATNCGGDQIRRGVVGSNAEFWNEDGDPADRSILDVAGVAIEEL